MHFPYPMCSRTYAIPHVLLIFIILKPRHTVASYEGVSVIAMHDEERNGYFASDYNALQDCKAFTRKRDTMSSSKTHWSSASVKSHVPTVHRLDFGPNV